jgi:hypothetical protein
MMLLTCDNETSPRGAGNTAEGSDPPVRYERKGAGVSLPTEEEWRPVQGYEDRYEVSSLGRVRSLTTRFHPGRVRRVYPSAAGYLAVTLSRDNRNAIHYVHRLVASAFCEREPHHPLVRHLDGDPSNNVASNLAWGTPEENGLDMVGHGRSPWANKTHCVNEHEYTPENTYWRSGGSRRDCRTCVNERSRRYKAKRRADFGGKR